MKENAFFKRYLKYFFGGILLLFSSGLWSQVEEEEETSDRVDIRGTIALEDIDKMIEAYEYDPESNTYIYTKRVDDFDVEYPQILTRQEYEDLLMRRNMRDYFRQKIAAADGRLSEEEQQDLLPRYYVNSGLFQSIFGSNTIDVKPMGSVETDIGIRYSKQDNPMISPRNRRTFALDFQPRISMSMQGKVGTNLDVNINYDTQATFGFQQQLVKLNYTPGEDDILQAIEVGHVNMPVNNSLIRGAQNLFGVKTKLQFGATTLTGVFSRQNSSRSTITAEGGGTVEEFELFALDYDRDRHFFLSQYFRNQYDHSLRNYPYIDSRVRITRVEVWVTNRQNRLGNQNNNFRNIIALQDLGESRLTNAPLERTIGLDLNLHPDFFLVPNNTPTNNANNRFDPNQIGSNYLNEGIRQINTAANGFNIQVTEGRDYVKLENARKLLETEYKFHPQLGYISLQQPLSNDEVLAVAYEYTIGSQVYRVGEFGNNGVDATTVGQDQDGIDVPTTQSLVLKMLKSALTSTDEPVWDLMMKNIYQLGGQQISQEGFRLNILYTDPQPLNYIQPAGATPLPEGVANTALLNVFHLDRLNNTNDPQEGGDGYFDFVANALSTDPFGNSGQGNMGGQGGYGNQGGMGGQSGTQNYNQFDGITIDAQYGRLIFTTVEPFGKHLFDKLSAGAGENYELDASYNENQRKYVYKNMYRRNVIKAQQESEKNKFQIKGRFRSSTGDGIFVGMNIPQGSVVVTSSGRTLIEGQDYTVDYQRGRVMIIDPALANSPVEVSVESNNFIQQQQRTFFGLDVEHRFSEKFILGATYLRLSEQPITVKSNYGEESVNNTIYGLNANYNSEAPFLTRWVNKLPNVDTDAPSTISFKGEFAYLQPGASRLDQLNGEATSYIDNFEATQTNIDITAPSSWHLSSVPVGYGSEATDLSSGYRRAKMSWYKIDPVFYSQSRRPDNITERELSSNRTRRIFKEELFPSIDIANGELLTVNTLDLTYYPKERGPYNFNPQFLVNNELPNPQNNWGGIMRSLASTNFEQVNVEYVEFWLMDPYTGNPGDHIEEANQGALHLNFGYISEDILQDGLKQYENGLPGAAGGVATISTIWGRVPASTALIYAFDTDPNNRVLQDAGLDGLLDDEEREKFPAFSGFQDPAADNYEFFLNAQGDILQRYKNYNGLQGNTPIEFTDTNRGSQNLPDIEDIDGDNTMNTINAYYDFRVDINPYPVVGTNYVVDVRETEVQLQDGSTTPVKWVQYKVPIKALAENAVGAISDLQSVRFMRMFVTGFTDEVTLRFGSLNLVQSSWLQHEGSLIEDPAVVVDGTNTGFEVRTLNVIDNFTREPIPYVIPPGVEREVLNQNNSIVRQNEQALALRVFKQNMSLANPSGLEPGDSRAVFKNVSVDMRRYNKLRMFLHAEALEPPTDSERLRDDEMVAFIRFGNDFSENYYQVEIPLKLTEWGESAASQIWKIENEIELHLRLLTQLKLGRTSDPNYDPSRTYFKYEDELDPEFAAKPNKLRIGIKGNPNFGLVRTIMIGVRNDTDILYANTSNAPRDIRGEVWFNELRVSDMDNKGGWAAVGALDARIADVASISVAANKSTIGFGALEQGPQERSREDVFQYSVATAIAADKLLPKKWNLNIPLSYTFSEETITPEFDPNNPDVSLKQAMEMANSAAEREAIKERSTDYTRRSSINLIGVKKNRAPEQEERFYDVENFTLSHTYDRTQHRNFEIEHLIDQQTRSAVDYNYGFKPWNIEPFKKSSEDFKKNKYFKWLTDLNFNPLPTRVSFNSNVLRQHNEQKYRMIDVEGLEISPLYRRNYFFNYDYGLNFQLTKSLNATYSVSNNNLVRNYIDENNRVDNENRIFDGYFDMGTPNMHAQQFTLDYKLPFNKLPFLTFLESTYAYTSNFTWNRSSDAFSNIDYEGINYNLGNTVQNANTHRLNAKLSMDKFYKYVGLVPSSQRKKKPEPKKEAQLKPGERVQRNAEIKESGGDSDDKSYAFTDALIGIVTSLKSVNVTYNQTNGTILPGYTEGLGFFGTARPSLGFVFGSQSDVRQSAAQNGWLTTYPEFNQMFSQAHTERLDIDAELRPINELIIQLRAQKQYTYNMSEQYDVTDGIYNSRSPYEFGNFRISTIMISSAFAPSDVNGSRVFDEFRNNRMAVAERLAMQRGIDINDPANRDQYGYPVGYGRTSQQVLIPAFLSAYTGSDVNKQNGFMRNFPLPNWNLTYRGLVRIPWFKERFNRISMRHAYMSSYVINSFQTNYEYQANPDAFDAGGNYVSPTVVGNIMMEEQFNPLVGVDFQTKSMFDFTASINRQRMLSLSFDNNLLTEMSGNTYTVGVGFRIKDVGFTTDFEGAGVGGRIVSDIVVRTDFSWNRQHTLIRYLDYDNTQIGSGTDRWEVRLTADYTFSKNFTGIFYYRHDFSKAVISTMYPLTNIQSGFTLRYNFGNQ